MYNNPGLYGWEFLLKHSNSVETKEFSPWSQDFSLTISIAFYNFQQCLIVFGYLDSLTWNIVMSPVVKILRHVCDFCMYTVHNMKLDMRAILWTIYTGYIAFFITVLKKWRQRIYHLICNDKKRIHSCQFLFLDIYIVLNIFNFWISELYWVNPIILSIFIIKFDKR